MRDPKMPQAPQFWTHLTQRAAGWSPTTRGILWTSFAGFIFSGLNATLRLLSAHMDPFQAQFLRYFLGLIVLLPVVLHHGLRGYWPNRVGPQFTRGFVHAVGLALWFAALPRIPLADMTAIGFTGPIFIMIGAHYFFKEPMRWERWAATLAGFAGVMIVVGPRISGDGGAGHLLMLASAPVFACSFLLTKALTRTESPGVIVVWQSITVALFSLPFALLHWRGLSGTEWAGFVLCGVLGSAGHYSLTRSFVAADISATQSAKFLDLMWSAIMGFLLFADVPNQTTLLGGMVISASTIWVARRDARYHQRAAVAATDRLEPDGSP